MRCGVCGEAYRRGRRMMLLRSDGTIQAVNGCGKCAKRAVTWLFVTEPLGARELARVTSERDALRGEHAELAARCAKVIEERDALVIANTELAKQLEAASAPAAKPRAPSKPMLPNGHDGHARGRALLDRKGAR